MDFRIDYLRNDLLHIHTYYIIEKIPIDITSVGLAPARPKKFSTVRFIYSAVIDIQKAMESTCRSTFKLKQQRHVVY